MINSFLITKVDDDQRLVFGYASVAARADGETVVDSQDDVISPATLERAAQNFMADYRKAGVMHERTSGVGTVVESLVITTDKLKALGLAPDALPQGWLITMRVEDPDVWKRVKSGELKAFSIGGRAKSVTA